MGLNIQLYTFLDTGGIKPHRVVLYEGGLLCKAQKFMQELSIYQELWYPERCGIVVAKDWINPFKCAYSKLLLDPVYYAKFGNVCGWGTYDDILGWLKELLEVCQQHPKLLVSVWRSDY